MATSHPRLVLALVAALGLAACVGAPEERYREAVAAADDAPDVEDYLVYFTHTSADLLRGMDAVKVRKSRFAYVDDIRKLLPRGDITKVEERGALVLLTIGDGRDASTVRMIQEGDLWVIDGLALDGVWKPLGEAAQ